MNGSVRPSEVPRAGSPLPAVWSVTEDGRTQSFRGSKSRNKVSVGEPAEGSLPQSREFKTNRAQGQGWWVPRCACPLLALGQREEGLLPPPLAVAVAVVDLLPCGERTALPGRPAIVGGD